MIALSILLPSKVMGWTKSEGFRTWTDRDYNIAFDYPSSFSPDVLRSKTIPQLKFRADSTSPSVVSISSTSITLGGIPCVAYGVYPLDLKFISLFSEFSKSGLVNATIDSEIDEKSEVGEFSVVSFNYCDPDNVGKVAYNHRYKGYLRTITLEREGRMAIMFVVFDPIYYDESFARDIVNTMRIVVSSEKTITSFSFSQGAGIITGTNISVAVPFGTDVRNLTSTIVLSGGTVSPLSGVAKDFTLPVIYTVTAEDETTEVYTVIVKVARNPAKEITAFSFLDIHAEGIIDGENILIVVPEKTEITKLIAIFDTTGDYVTIDNIAQESGKTINDFTKPVIYRVVAADESYMDYIVTVKIGE
jgi:hypothetical protein